MYFLFVLGLLVSLISPAVASSYQPQDCVNCHQSQNQNWQQSHHAHSMAIADTGSVLADFNTEAKHFSQTARFYRKNQQFFAEVSSGDKAVTYQVKYTFGFDPLQQYLVATAQGKLQVLPFAWDSRPKEQGGQRWIHLYDEDIKANDRLHWQQPLQNYNGMCADCHSDDLKPNYDPNSDSFNTKSASINVSCLSCHDGKERPHQQSTPKPKGGWVRAANEDIAHWQGEPRDSSFMDTCYACHSLRTPITNGFRSDKPYLDQFSPSWLSPPWYYADGQIKEEVYVMGSFRQSKMYQAGVVCTDCHDPHSMELKAKGNNLCSTCHNPETYDVKSHHGHDDNKGSECVSCHMPTTTYMQVDPRRDHSFSIPRPHLSEQGIGPNACSSCHKDKDNQWATSELQKLHGKPKPVNQNLTQYWSLMLGTNIGAQAHYQIIMDESLSEMIRATAINHLGQVYYSIPSHYLASLFSHNNNLIRLAITQFAINFSPQDKQKYVLRNLTDSFKAIRIAAANALVDVSIPIEHQPAFNDAMAELTESFTFTSWRGEGRINHAVLLERQGNYQAAQQQYLASIKMDPYFTASYINLADLYKRMGQDIQGSQVLEQGIKANPQEASLFYSLGLYWIRAKNMDKAVQNLVKAVKFDTTNPQYAYMYVLAIDAQGNTKQALFTLGQIIKTMGEYPQLVQLQRQLAAKAE
ncbi:cytochrome c3 family protein [Paraferrimonas sp. SM1919]|uniref:cytochrome c3 family protein n=1 Tax=Paraferrimonas sp. SM1919 TaxID=2662263 RepID=UPI0013D0BDE8|nr:cytochrome c3 family protein [Paraferrimonas sp. SM1919]